MLNDLKITENVVNMVTISWHLSLVQTKDKLVITLMKHERQIKMFLAAI